MQGVEIKIGNVPRVYPLIHESILRYQCSTSVYHPLYFSLIYLGRTKGEGWSTEN